jgi:hypothetical protein
MSPAWVSAISGRRGEAMESHISKRAQILKRVLKQINAKDFQDLGDHMVFGTESKLRRDELAPLIAQNLDFKEKVDDALDRYFGHVLSQERTSLLPASDGKVLFNRLEGLAKGSGSKFAVKYVEIWRDVLTEPRTEETADALPDAQIDVLDQRYTEEIIEKLEKVVSRASGLQKFELGRIPNRRVQIYFEEAHRCYLYGFKVACVVMCRAILESALKETIDPKGELRPKERRESHILKMINKAKIYGRLCDPLPQWAAEVKDAGDSAVHDVEAFETDYPAERVEDILCKARKVVESLYGPPVHQV